MPDLQTALSKVITEWEAPAQLSQPAPAKPAPKGHRFSPTNNVSRATFDFIKANPGTQRKIAIASLVAKGYKSSSVSSLITQMLRQRMVTTVSGGLFTTQQEFGPLRHKEIRKVSLRKLKAANRAAAPAEKATPQPEVVVKAAEGEAASTLIDSLTLRQARELYIELRKIFKD